MSGPPTGIYQIIRHGIAAPPVRPLGANIGRPVEPVIVGGESTVWFVQKLDKGNYHLYLEEGGSKRVGFGEGGKVFVGDARLIVEWQIKKQKDREERIYSIEEPGDFRPTRAWTLDSTVPGTEVKLEICGIPRDGQLWVFRPVK